VELANHLGLSERNAQDREATVSFVHEWIRENRQCLVILDNVENLHDIYDYLLPLGESQIILTTRTQVIGADAQTLEVVEMSIEEGALFLLRRAKILPLNASLSDTSELIRIQAQDIAEAMGGLPLALEQAGSYIEETGCSLSGYLHLIKRQKTGMQSEPGPVSANYYRSVASTWMLSFEMTRQANPVAAELLYLCAFLKPDKIYEDLLLAGVPALGPTFQTIASNPLELHRAIGELRKYSLVRTDPGSSTLSIHRLVQEVIQNTLEFGEQRQWVKLTVKVVNMAFPLLTTAEWHEAWPICQRYSSQAEACAALIDQWELEGEEVSQLLSKLGKYLEERTQFAEAERVYHQAIKIDRQYYGEEHIRVADDFVNLAISSTRQAKYERALEFYKRAIFIQDKVLGSEHLDSKMLKNYIDLLRKVDQEGEATKWDKRMKRKPVKQLQKVLRRRAVNDDDKDIIYDKENYWTYQKRLGDFNSDIHISDIPGASFQYNFVGVGIEILSDTSSVHGEVDIYLDDVYLQTINTSRISDRLTQTIIFEKTNLESGTHTLKVVLVKGVFILDALAVFFYDSEDAEA